jgi:undecaprenyl-diphosphatase
MRPEPSGRFHRLVRQRKPRALLSGALVSLAGYLALAVLAAQQEFVALDYGTRDWVRVLRHETFDLPMRIVTELGDRLGLIPLILVAVAVLWRANRRWALALPVLMAGTWAVQLLAKWIADRPRPNLAPHGFPSGHVLSLVVFFGLMLYLVATASRRRRRWRVLACAVCVVPVAVVAFSRLYLDKHWLTDLAGGLMVGAAYLLLAIWVVEVLVMSRHTRSGVSGSDRTTAPKGDSASSTALATAAGPGMDPPSPTPLAPSGVNGEGVSSRPTSISGTSSAVGFK